MTSNSIKENSFNWNLKEKRIYNINVNKMLNPEDTLREINIDYKFVIQLIKKTDQYFLFSCKAEYISFDSDHLPDAYFHKYANQAISYIDIHYKTKIDGEFLEVTNWENLFNSDQYLFEIDSTSNETQLEKRQNRTVKALGRFISKENIDIEFVQKIRLIHSYFSPSLIKNKKIYRDNIVYNYMIRDKIKTESKLEVREVDYENNIISGVEIFESDEEVNDSIKTYWETKNEKPTERDSVLMNFGLNQETKFKVNYKTGFIVSLSNTNSTQFEMKNMKVMKEITPIRELKMNWVTVTTINEKSK